MLFSVWIFDLNFLFLFFVCHLNWSFACAESYVTRSFYIFSLKSNTCEYSNPLIGIYIDEYCGSIKNAISNICKFFEVSLQSLKK